MSDYGLDDRAIGVQSSVEAKDFSSSLCVQISSGALPASCQMGRLVVRLWWGETDVSELWLLQAYCLPLGDCDVDHGMMI
jgi:hypothetical protein